MPRFHVSYDVVTPESAEDGDLADCGFLCALGLQHTVRHAPSSANIPALGADCAMSLREAVALFGDRHGAGLDVNSTWFTQSDASVDYGTGEETRLSLHVPDTCTAASFERLRRLLA